MDQKLLNCDRDTHELIVQILKRLGHLAIGATFDNLHLSMDLTVCHNLRHVNLTELSTVELASFLHDLTGITQHLNRETGELTECFLPRCRSRACASVAVGREGGAG